MNAPPTIEDFMRAVAEILGADGVVLDPLLPLGDQVPVDSLRLTELAIVLEEEFGLDLPDDIDLRRSAPAGLCPSAAAVDAASTADGG